MTLKTIKELEAEKIRNKPPIYDRDKAIINEAYLDALKEVLEVVVEKWEIHLSKLDTPRYKHNCQLCRFIEELKARINGK